MILLLWFCLLNIGQIYIASLVSLDQCYSGQQWFHRRPHCLLHFWLTAVPQQQESINTTEALCGLGLHKSYTGITLNACICGLYMCSQKSLNDSACIQSSGQEIVVSGRPQWWPRVAKVQGGHSQNCKVQGICLTPSLWAHTLILIINVYASYTKELFLYFRQ